MKSCGDEVGEVETFKNIWQPQKVATEGECHEMKINLVGIR